MELPKNLIEAIIQQESSGLADALRYEAHYQWLYRPDYYARLLKITLETEKQTQKFSYGLMQIMGAVCRELGFDKPMYYLFDPELNISYGKLYLQRLSAKYNTLTDVISAYNQGSPRRDENGLYFNQAYVDSVMRKLMDIEVMKL